MRELNWKSGQTAELRLLGDVPAVSAARILEVSGKRMRLAAELPVESGAAVRLDWDGQLLLGQVLYKEPGGFWMEIHHMLFESSLGLAEKWLTKRIADAR